MSDFKTNLNDNRLAEEAAHGLDGVIDKTDSKHSKHLYGLVVQYEDIDAGGIVYHSTYLKLKSKPKILRLEEINFPLHVQGRLLLLPSAFPRAQSILLESSYLLLAQIPPAPVERG